MLEKTVQTLTQGRQTNLEQRVDGLEHFTAGWAEERRKDREEYRQIWRDTQRHLNELTLKIADTNDAIARMSEKNQLGFAAARDADQELRVRIAASSPRWVSSSQDRRQSSSRV